MWGYYDRHNFNEEAQSKKKGRLGGEDILTEGAQEREK